MNWMPRRLAPGMIAALAVLGLAALAPRGAEAARLDYPPAYRGPVVDDYFGTQVPDPYRWLESDVRQSDSVATWVGAENELTEKYLSDIPERQGIKERLTKLWNYERFSAPSKAGGHYFYSRNDGLQNQSVLYMMDSLNGEPRVVLDPNKLSTDGTVALGGTSVDPEGRYMAYGTSTSGSDWQEWHVKDLATLTDLPDRLTHVKFSGATWTPDGRGFFYGRYDLPTDGTDMTGTNRGQKIYYHRVGSPQEEDALVFSRPDKPDWFFGVNVTDDNRYLFVSIVAGSDNKNLLYYKKMSDLYAQPMPLVEEFEAQYSVLDNDGPVLYVQTDKDASRGKIIRIDLRHPERTNWKTIIPESAETLQGVNVLDNLFVCTYLKDAASAVRIYRLDGRFLRNVDLPGIGSAGGFGGSARDTETFFTFSSYATPPSIYRYDMITGQSTLFRQARVDFNPADYVVKEVFITSKDGTKVPVFITHRKNLKLDGQNPTLLYAYGGFNISMTPGFSVSRLGWLEMGGVYAVACLRGGSEYGEDWHKAGTKAQKQNVFDDFIASAEWLIANKYTSTPKLAIMGGSNGGLLVGACMTQRPDLFGACIPQVGVMDMLRFHKFTIGRAWTGDYGSSDNAEDFKYLRAYSPLHNLKEGTSYPPTLVTTADHDDRVVPGHSFKFTAALQHAQGGSAPTLVRIETKAGHGGGKPTSKQIEEISDIYAFLVKNLGMRVRS